MNKKKSVMIFVTFLFIFLLCDNAYAITRASCTHKRNSFVRDVTTYIVINEEKHRVTTYPVYKCTLCEEHFNGEPDTYTEPHILSYRDKGHVGKKHCFAYVCRCGYQEVTYVPCDGPPCGTIM